MFKYTLSCQLKGCKFMWGIVIVLLILWLLGVVTANTIGGLIHVLLVIAIIVVLIRVIKGNKIF